LVERVDGHIYMVDLTFAGVSGFISSYIVVGEDVAIVETGPSASAEGLLAALEEVGVNRADVKYLVVTHIHLDHAGASGHLIERLPNAKLLVHPRGAPHMADPRKLLESARKVMGPILDLYGGVKPVPPGRILQAEDGMTIDLGGGVKLTVVETPGHATHHMSILDEGTRGVFTGDSAGVYIPELDALVPTAPPPFNLEKALRSLGKMMELKPERIYYTHFGPHGEALRMLEEYRRQLTKLGEIIGSMVREGKGDAEIMKAVLDEVPQYRRVVEELSDHPIISGMVSRAVEGIISYFRWLMEKGLF